MRSIMDKLRYFNEVMLKDATAERDRILHQVKALSEERIAREKSKFQEEAELFLRKETTLAEIEKNSIISRAIIESKQLLAKTRNEIIETIYNDVENRLIEFVQKEEYIGYLSRQIIDSCSLAGEGKLIVYLCKRDMERLKGLLEDIKPNLPQDVAFEQTGNEIIGGCKILNQTAGIIVDNTFIKRLESSRDSILEICGLHI
ncbi:MAG TPA: hypothetical protein GXX14_04445 [Clostridiaceae bacterium]|nr:hypothetical protein [Clostridiaceae bacterium]